MRMLVSALVLVSTLTAVGGPPGAQDAPAPARGHRLQEIAWPQAERLLTADAVVVIPLGAGSKEHGPHLTLGNDLKLAEYLTTRIVETTEVVVAPTVTYHYYPAFLEYPGSTSLTLESAREMVVDVAKSLTRYGPRRFYVLNTGVSTLRALEPAASALANDGVLLRYTDLPARLETASRGLREQSGGTHADEVETSMMLYIDPSAVDMTKAVKDYTPATGAMRLTRTRDGGGTYSPTGTWGDPTLATRDKGRAFVDSLVAGIQHDIADLRTAKLPARRTVPAPAPPAPTPTATSGTPPDPATQAGDRCTAGQVRAIFGIGDAYAAHWVNADAERFGLLWSENGNIIHTDGTIERGPTIITQNRIALFKRTEYRGSRHPLTFPLIRCLSPDIAVADGKWELRGLRDARGQPAPPMAGQATIVVKRYGDQWKIEAYRYTVTAPK